MGHKLKRADRMSDAFKIVALSVRKVVHWVGFPLIARAMMVLIDHTIDDRIAEVHIRISHIYLGAQNHCAFGHFACVHLLKERQTFFNRPVAIRTGLPWLCRRAFLCGNLFTGLLVNISFAFLNQTYCKVP